MVSAQNAQGPQIPIVLLKEGTTENNITHRVITLPLQSK